MNSQLQKQNQKLQILKTGNWVTLLVGLQCKEIRRENGKKYNYFGVLNSANFLGQMRFRIFILATLLQCCNSNKSQLEYDVIKATALDLIGTDYYLEPIPKPPYKPIHPDSISSWFSEDEIEINGFAKTDSIKLSKKITREKEIQEYDVFNWEKYKLDSTLYEYKLNNRQADTSILVLLVNDSLIQCTENEFLNSLLSIDKFKLNFNIDSTWRTLALELVNKNTKSKKFDFNYVAEIGKYMLYNSDTYLQKSGERVIGNAAFSRVVFNDNKTRGCFYFQFVCGPLCGHGVIVFVEKVNNKWQIEGNREVWVS